MRQAEGTRALAVRTRRLVPQLPSRAVRADLDEFASQLEDRAVALEEEAVAISDATFHQAMTMWRLLPVRRERSKNWARSLYDGSVGPVIVRARSPLDARFLAAEEFDVAAPSAGQPLNSPWLDEGDTTIEACVDGRFGDDDAAAVLHPTRAHVTAVPRDRPRSATNRG
ncbi:MAG: hypothetical protein AB7O88_23330 [Reyranellaceae bacterium]